MKQIYKMETCSNMVSGMQIIGNKLYFHAVLHGKQTNGLLLYSKNDAEVVRIDFDDSVRTGHVYQGMISGLSYREYNYTFHEDGKAVLDLGAKALIGHQLFGLEHCLAKEKDAIKACAFVEDDFDWKNDKKPNIAYEDSVLYGMHVRGFTKDASSKVKEAGTFAGVVKKVSYLQKLGITGVVLQPIYESDECSGVMLNYWGYLPGFYYTPKNAYAYSDNAVHECKMMVRELHKRSIEVFLQFYFPEAMKVAEIERILLFWSREYHIDGFQLIGSDIPYQEIAESPYLSDLKLIMDRALCNHKMSSFTRGVQQEEDMLPSRRMAYFNREYMYTLRRFLKGDADVLQGALLQFSNNGVGYGTINFMASYDGFRLYDVVSYDNKHNLENGENNQDGECYNCSWNCGIEGPTRKKSILQLREKQFRNAWLMLLTSQGTPYFFMGDEWGKSALGNNNPYCQDQEMTWQKWNLKKNEKERMDYVCQWIRFRKNNKVFCQKMPLLGTDYLSCGYPDISYHGMEAWKPDLSREDRQIGILLCGSYLFEEKNKDKHMYLIYNMHWEKKQIAFPRLEKGLKWRLLVDTENTENSFSIEEESVEEGCETGEQIVFIPGRSIRIYISVRDEPFLLGRGTC